MGNMLGPKCHECPYGRSCSCNEAPGIRRRIRRRNVKRSEKNQWKQSIRRDIHA